MSSATSEDLRALVHAFTEVTWPAPREVAASIAESLGWTLELERPKGIYFRTAYSFGKGRANFLVVDGDITEVTVHVSERIDKDDVAFGSQLAGAFASVQGELEQILGVPAHTRRGENPRVSWDLANGGRIAVERLNSVVALVILQRTFADIERFEESRRIPADRVAEADLEA